MKGERMFSWMCLTCGDAGEFARGEYELTSLICHAAFRHAQQSENCPAIDSAQWKLMGEDALTIQARDWAKEEATHGR